jgi:ectoine hydroxylase-related dioxygenase (phytanoyl-CoA dioxygenase family)
LVPLLLDGQREDGSWNSYWWFEDAYATALAVQALHAAAPTDRIRRALASAGGWARAQVQALEGNATAFKIALLLRILLLDDAASPEAEQCLAHLLNTQRDNGGWRGGASLRIPRPDDHDPSGVQRWERWLGAASAFETPEEVLQHTFRIFSLDQQGVFTVATVLETLHLAEQLSSPAELDAPRRASKPVLELAAEDVASFRENGHIVLHSVLDPAEVQRFRPALVEAVYEIDQAEAKEDRAALDRQAFVRSEGVWHFNSDVRHFILSERLGAIAAQLLGVERVRLFHDQAFFKLPGGGRTPWHQDSFFWPLKTEQVLTLWIPLTNIDPAMGSLRFLSRSHRLGSLGNIDAFNRSEATIQQFVEEHDLTMTEQTAMTVGSLSAHYGWMVHGAAPNQSDAVREVITIIYYADGATIDDPPPEDAEPFTMQAARIREKDRLRWFPGLQPGDRAVSRENPLVFDVNHCHQEG